MQLLDTKILFTKPHYLDNTIRETIWVELYPNNINKESSQHLCRSWKSLIHTLKEHRNPPHAGCKQLFSGPQTGNMGFFRTEYIQALTFSYHPLKLTTSITNSIYTYVSIPHTRAWYVLVNPPTISPWATASSWHYCSYWLVYLIIHIL
jgi:hypothetical protein